MQDPSTAGSPWPSELRLNAAKDILCVSFLDGFSANLEAEFLRVESPSAEVKGHSAAERKLVPGKRNVRIRNIEPVGNYAVRLIFDDGHTTGIYAWAYLRELAEEHGRMWNAYIEALAAAGLTRDP